MNSHVLNFVIDQSLEKTAKITHCKKLHLYVIVFSIEPSWSTKVQTYARIAKTKKQSGSTILI